MSFGARLKSERKRLKMTQPQLAEFAGTTRQSQLRYEKDEQKPGAEYLEKIATVGIDVQYLLTGIRSEMALTPEMRTLIQFYMDATPAIRKAALAVLVSGGSGSGGQNVMVNGNVTGSVIAHTIKGSGE
ncbi:helix-turn-helix domain-containing protein [Bilophila wadsworthia]|uniref:helix-turn-helix domain-containing protein n=1 Tax=Bilophila wadsworthia TaxID=35833 RepID=UPI0026754A75|nr:helix-turn-helix transcriptional regulator [Bilophila wadsworthia]